VRAQSAPQCIEGGVSVSAPVRQRQADLERRLVAQAFVDDAGASDGGQGSRHERHTASFRDQPQKHMMIPRLGQALRREIEPTEHLLEVIVVRRIQ